MPVLLVLIAIVLLILGGLGFSGKHFLPGFYAAACLVAAYFWADLTKAFG